MFLHWTKKQFQDTASFFDTNHCFTKFGPVLHQRKRLKSDGRGRTRRASFRHTRIIAQFLILSVSKKKIQNQCRYLPTKGRLKIQNKCRTRLIALEKKLLFSGPVWSSLNTPFAECTEFIGCRTEKILHLEENCQTPHRWRTNFSSTTIPLGIFYPPATQHP